MRQRITQGENGPIFHRDETQLTKPRRCLYGHLAPKYRGRTFGQQAACVVCQQLSSAAQYARSKGLAGPSRPFLAVRTWRGYQEARTHHHEAGGYLLRMTDDTFITTDDSYVVRRLRGSAWLRLCEARQCWDDVEMAQNQELVA